MDELRTDTHEYKSRFINYCLRRGMPQQMAEDEYSSWVAYAHIWGNPESDASECISYYN